MSDCYPLLTALCESRLIPSRESLKKWDAKTLRELTYFYFMALRILLSTEPTQNWARNYCNKVVVPSNFDAWRTDGNDFYVLLHALSVQAEAKLSVGAVRDWIHHSTGSKFEEYTQRLFNRLDGMLGMHDSSFKAMRRLVMHWGEDDARERESLIVKIIQQIQSKAPSSELLSHLKHISKQFSDDDQEMAESATAGATGAASVASVVGGIGAGFAPGQTWRGIYNDAPKPIRHPNVKKS